MPETLANEIIVDLLRSGWLVETGRASLYSTWGAQGSGHRSRWPASTERAQERAQLIETALAARGRLPDHGLAPAHAAWITSLVGEHPEEVPFGDLLLARLGDWVDGHLAAFLDGGERLEELGRQERAALEFPTHLPPAPPFEPLEAPDLAPPGATKLRIGVLGDLHVGSRTGERMARAAVADLNRADCDLVIQLGDITDHGHKEEFQAAFRLLGELEVPVTTMMGNHDVVSLEEQRLSGREYYGNAFGRSPDGVLLEQAGFRIAVLDSIEDVLTPFAPFDLVSGSFVEGPGGAVVRGALTAPQHEILAELATRGAPPAIVFLHHPPQPFTSFPPIVFGLRDEDTGRLHATVDSGNVWGVFAGHTHRNARTRDFDGVPAHEVGIPRDYPCGYGLIDVSDDGYAYRFLQISDEALLRAAYEDAGVILRRYAKGRREDRAFTWRRPANDRSNAPVST